MCLNYDVMTKFVLVQYAHAICEWREPLVAVIIPPVPAFVM